MSQATVCAAVVAKCAAIPDIAAARMGRPIQMPWNDAPLVLVWTEGPTEERARGFGPHAPIHVTYPVVLLLLLGQGGLDETEAIRRGALFTDRFRYAFWTDRTLGGACWQSTLSGARDNFQSYHTQGGADRYSGYPTVRWRLTVTEEIIADAPAQP